MVRYRDILSCTQSMKSIVKMLFTLYNIKTKIHLPQPMVAIADFLYPFYTFLFSCSQRFLNYVAFKCFGFEHTWWMVLNIPDEWFWTYLMNGFEHTWWMVLNIPDEWFWSYLMNGFERTWWMVLNIPDEWFWTYLMNGFSRSM